MTDKQIDNRTLFEASGDKLHLVSMEQVPVNKTLVTIELHSLSHCDLIRQSYVTSVIRFLDGGQ